MTSSVPEYYRHLAAKADTKDKPPPVQQVDPSSAARPASMPAPSAGSTTFVANEFLLQVADDWDDATIYILSGPVTDDIQHNITIVVDPKVLTDSIEEYADLQIRPLEEDLKGCRVLLREAARLANGMPAYRVIYSWCPIEGVRFYQEQVYALHDGVGYKMTATFTRKTRKTLGPQVERMMLSLEPRSPDANPPPQRR